MKSINDKNIDVDIVTKINVPNKINGPKKVLVAQNQVDDQTHDYESIRDDHTYDDESDHTCDEESVDNIQAFDESVDNIRDFEDKESLYDE